MLPFYARSTVLKRGLQTTARRQFVIPFLPLLPQKPGGVQGTPNDAFVPPKPNKMEGSYHWWLEKSFSYSILPLTTAAFLTTGTLSTALDSALCLSALGYSYMEFHSCITDYVQPRQYGKYHNYALYLLGAGTLVSLLGIYNLETQKGGFKGLVKSLWYGEEEAEKK